MFQASKRGIHPYYSGLTVPPITSAINIHYRAITKKLTLLTK